MSADSFHVSLPSNASHTLFPSNTNGRYRTRLAKSLPLSVGRWSVGVSEVQFTRSWPNVDVGVVSWLERVDDSDLEILRRDPSSELPVSDVDQYALYRRKRVSVTRGHYTTPSAVIDAVTQAVSESVLASIFGLSIDRTTNRVRVRFESDSASPYRKLSFSADLSEILGLYEPIEPKSGPLCAIGTHAVNVNRRLHTMYLYSDVVSNRMVGDKLQPLLRVIALNLGDTTRAYDNVHIEFANIDYHPVSNSEGREIELKLCDSEGNVIEFTVGKVTVDLHFKRLD